MPGTFTYTRSTNTLVVTGGTSGSPADFASMLTADRAGSVTLLAAWTPISNTKALTYQVAPAEVLALLISFVIASKTTETDYIFITGTDAWSAAQTESIDVSAGNGTYVSTKRFRTITNIDCSDNAAGGGTVWADGAVQVTQPQWGVVWNSGTASYQCDAILEIGDGSTATFFKTIREVFIGVNFKVFDAATFQSGELSANNAGYDGSSIILTPTAQLDFINAGATTANISIYASSISIKSNYATRFYQGNAVSVFDSLINSNSIANSTVTVLFGGMANCTLKRVGVTNFYALYFSSITATSIENLYSLYSYRGIGVLGGTGTVRNLYLIDPTSVDVRLQIGTLYLIDTNKANLTLSYSSTNKLYEEFSVNLKIVDSAGAAIESATTRLIDKNSTEAFSVSTDANGEIVEQIIVYRYLTGTTSTVYSPHVLTVSKAGYQTLIIPAITIDAPIDWTVELQPAGTANMSRVRVGH